MKNVRNILVIKSMETITHVKSYCRMKVNSEAFCITISQFLLDQVDVIAVKVRIAKDLNLSFSNNP